MDSAEEAYKTGVHFNIQDFGNRNSGNRISGVYYWDYYEDVLENEKQRVYIFFRWKIN